MSPRWARGFTLIEVMITAAILALVISLIYGSFAASIKTMQIGEQGGEVYRKARVALERMTMEIGCAYLPPDEEGETRCAFVGGDVTVEGIPQDTLQFTSAAPMISGTHKGLKEVRFYLAPDPQEDIPCLMMREDPWDGQGRPILLAEGVQGVNITYYDSQGREFRRWDTNTPLFKKKLPRQVRITLFFREGGEPIPFSTRAFIPLGGK